MKFFLFYICFFVTTVSFGQSADSTVIDSVETISQEEYGEEDSYALPDSGVVSARTVDSETLQRLKSDPELKYKEPPTIAESLWDRFLMWIQQMIGSIFESAVTTNWGKVTAYVIGFVLIVVLIMMVLRVNAFKVFYYGEGASAFKYNVLDENIHQMDFEKLIEEAISKNDYRTGIRLIFLYALKMLSDKNHIHWAQGKTNHDYIDELKLTELKSGFSDLNYYFEYAWYGDFNINSEMFDHVQNIFKAWRTNIK